MAGGPSNALGTGERDLRQMLAVVRTFPPAEACRLGAQMARGLAAVHATGGVHAGLCAAEVRFGNQPHRDVRLGPPGRAWADRPAPPWAPPGLHAYVAPEVAAGAAPSAAADLYGLGALLHELAAGAPPFAGEPREVLRAQIRAVPVRPDGVPDQLWVLIAALLAKEPAARPGPAGQVAGYLDAIASRVAAVPPAPPPHDRRSGVRRAEPTPMVLAPAPVALPEPVAAVALDPVDSSVVISEPAAPVKWALPPRLETAPWERPAWGEPPPTVPTPVLPAVLMTGAADETAVLPVISAPLAPDLVFAPPALATPPIPEVPLRLVMPTRKRRGRQRSALLVLSAVAPVLLFFGAVRAMTGSEGGEGAIAGAAEEGTADPAADLTTDQPGLQPGPLPTVTAPPSAAPTPAPATLEQHIAALAELASRNGGAVVDAETDGLYGDDDLAAVRPSVTPTARATTTSTPLPAGSAVPLGTQVPTPSSSPDAD